MAADLEINKAVMFLKQNQLPQAIENLKAFDKDSVIAINAAINLSFIYHLVSGRALLVRELMTKSYNLYHTLQMSDICLNVIDLLKESLKIQL